MLNLNQNNFKLVNDIVGVCGLGKMLVLGASSDNLAASLIENNVDAVFISALDVINDLNSSQALNFADETFDCLILNEFLEGLSLNLSELLLPELYRITKKFLYLKINLNTSRSETQSRAYWENKLFGVGFRKHPLYYYIVDYHALNYETTNSTIIIPLEKIASHILDVYPLSALKEERDLHMDMMREAGARSDAHIIRYLKAAEFIRPGDVVLDAACGLGYGSYILYSASKAANIIGIDGSEYGVRYSNLNYSIAGKLNYQLGFLPSCLKSIPSGSVDFITSFETLEHVKEPLELLKEFYRILSPGGRIITSVPNDWSDETGEDPNPFHFHVYDWHKLKDQMAAYFDCELAFNQTASQCKDRLSKHVEWKIKNRLWQQVDLELEHSNDDSEWWIILGMKNPHHTDGVTYRESLFGYECPPDNVIAFGRDYKNPWLVRAIVSIGLRVNNKNLIKKYATYTLDNDKTNTPDRGAALAVLGYQMLELNLLDSDNNNQILSVIKEIDQYVEMGNENNNPQVFRWQISLLFLNALLYKKLGNLNNSLHYFDQVVHFDVLKYSPTLGTKIIEASYQAGLICVSLAKHEKASEYWINGLTYAYNIVKQPLSEYIGKIDSPLIFGVVETEELFTLAAKCVKALYYSNIAKGREYNLHAFSNWNSNLEIDRKNMEISWLYESIKSINYENQLLKDEIYGIKTKTTFRWLFYKSLLFMKKIIKRVF